MAITLVQGPYQATGQKNSGNIVVTLGSNPTNGNSVVLMSHCIGAGNDPTISGITETNVSWSLVKRNAAWGMGEIWIGVVSASADKTITVTYTGGTSIWINIIDACEWSGLSGSVDKTAGDPGNVGPGPVPTGTTDATTQASELAIGETGAVSETTSGRTNQSSPTNSFTLLDGVEVAIGTHYASIGYLYKILSTTGAQSSQVTLSGTPTYWSGCIATFFAGGAPAVVEAPKFRGWPWWHEGYRNQAVKPVVPFGSRFPKFQPRTLC